MEPPKKPNATPGCLLALLLVGLVVLLIGYGMCSNMHFGTH